jgi:hypothetical protein
LIPAIKVSSHPIGILNALDKIILYLNVYRWLKYDVLYYSQRFPIDIDPDNYQRVGFYGHAPPAGRSYPHALISESTS